MDIRRHLNNIQNSISSNEIVKVVFGSRLTKFIVYFLFAICVLVGIWQATNTNFNYYSLFLAVIAMIIAFLAISVAENSRKRDNEIASIEKCLYSFYYPAFDFIEGYSIQGMKCYKRDIEHIALYRRLAKEETRDEFEIYRNGNYKEEDSRQLLEKLKTDISELETKLKELENK